MDHERVPAPAVLDRLPGVPEPLLGLVDLLEEADVVAPRDLCNDLLHNFLVWPGLREAPHVLEVAAGEPLAVGELLPEVGGELVDHLRPPREPVLPLEDVPADRPVEEDELAVHGERCLNAGSTHPVLQVSKEVFVALWSLAE